MAPNRRTTMTNSMANFFSSVIPKTDRLSVPGQGPTHGHSKMYNHHMPSSPFLGATSLNGMVAVVTGSSRSTGAAIAKCLGEHGANVVVNYVNDANGADEVVRVIRSQGKGGAIAVKADASSVEGGKLILDETMKTFGRLDILVLNTGIMEGKSLENLDEATFNTQFQINVKAPLFLAKAAAPLLASPGGRIIFFSSTLTASSSISPHTLCYLATKGAIEQISRVLAKDLGARGITVNTISLGPIDSPEFREGKPQNMIDSIAKQSPFKRLGDPEDVAPLVGFLVSPAAQWVNGQNIRVDGGAIV